MLQEDFLAKGVEIQALGKGDSSDTQGKARIKAWVFGEVVAI